MKPKKKRNRPLKYEPEKRVKHIFEQVWKHGGINKAAPHILSEYTNRPMSCSGIKKYLENHGYKIIFGPYLINNQGHLIDPESL